MFTSIAVPLDGSAFGDLALPYAVSLARRGGATLQLMHVHRSSMPGAALEPLPQYRFEDVVEADEATDSAAFLRESRRLREIAQLLADEHGLVVSSCILHGSPADALAERAQTSGASLIVMATHAAGGVLHAWLASTSDAVARDSALPVLLVQPGAGATPPDGDVRFRRMLVPLDGSSFSEAIVAPAVDLARLMGAEITLLHVASPADGPWLRSRSRAPGESPDYVEAYLESLVETLPPQRPPVRIRVVAHWSPARAILDELEQGDYDLVAMASHGRGGVRPLLLGSTADRVLRGTRLPVLLVCPHGAAHPEAAREAVANGAA